MEQTYEALLQTIKHSYLSACWNYTYTSLYDYNGDSYYELERVNYADGQVSSLRALVDQLGIKVTDEEIDLETASAKKYFEDEQNGSEEDNEQ